MPAVYAQSSSYSSSNPAYSGPTLDQNLNLAQNLELAQNQPSGDAQQAPQANQGEISVQERIRLRRAQRRSTAIHDAYDHRWETYLDTGYLRFTPGPGLQRLTYYAWETGLTRFSTERLGYTLVGRGYFGTAYVGHEPVHRLFHTARDQPVRRDRRPGLSLLPATEVRHLRPRDGRLGTRQLLRRHESAFRPSDLGLYPDANTFAASASVIGELNVSPNLALKLAPEYFFTGFGSTMQASRGFTGGLVYRWGKQ